MTTIKAQEISLILESKRKLVAFFLLSLFSVLLSSLYAQEVRAEVDTMNIRIGEQFQYKITIGDTANVIIPRLNNLKGLEIVDSIPTDTIDKTLIQKYIMTGFDSGAYYIPAQQIFIRGRAFRTDSLLINVATVAIDTTKQKMFPIKSIRGEPFVFDDFMPGLIWILVGMLLTGVIVYYLMNRKKKVVVQEVITPGLAPFEEALERLQKLDEKLLWQNNQVKQYYSELTEIVRGYIEKELKIPALESTTDELVETIQDFNDAETISASRESIRKLKELLREADLVKFAKSKPLSHEIEEDRKDAEFVLNELKPKTEEKKEDELD